MNRESNLIKEIASLDMMINALAVELAEQLGSKSRTAESRKLIGEITDALEELRLRRGVRKMLLSASVGSSTAVEKKLGIRAGRRSSVRLSPAA
ncbi:MAG TPA: hypothetical protein VKA70_12160 [Blastocatellia bacterium]|nr:hypothetical protein [Blastocatellia bacterium]